MSSIISSASDMRGGDHLAGLEQDAHEVGGRAVQLRRELLHRDAARHDDLAFGNRRVGRREPLRRGLELGAIATALLAPALRRATGATTARRTAVATTGSAAGTAAAAAAAGRAARQRAPPADRQGRRRRTTTAGPPPPSRPAKPPLRRRATRAAGRARSASGGPPIGPRVGDRLCADRAAAGSDRPVTDRVGARASRRRRRPAELRPRRCRGRSAGIGLSVIGLIGRSTPPGGARAAASSVRGLRRAVPAAAALETHDAARSLRRAGSGSAWQASPARRRRAHSGVDGCR